MWHIRFLYPWNTFCLDYTVNCLFALTFCPFSFYAKFEILGFNIFDIYTFEQFVSLELLGFYISIRKD